MSFEPDSQVEITYKGAPRRKDDAQEAYRRSKFLVTLRKSLKLFQDAAGALFRLEAEHRMTSLRRKQAKADLDRSMAEKNLADARKTAAETAEITARMDRENSKQIKPVRDLKQMSAEELSRTLAEDMAEVMAIAEELRLRYGTEIRLTVAKPASQQQKSLPS